jgi:hypothetical protein
MARVDMLDMLNSEMNALFRLNSFVMGDFLKMVMLHKLISPIFHIKYYYIWKRFSLLPNFHKHLNDLIY